MCRNLLHWCREIITAAYNSLHFFKVFYVKCTLFVSAVESYLVKYWHISVNLRRYNPRAYHLTLFLPFCWCKLLRCWGKQYACFIFCIRCLCWTCSNVEVWGVFFLWFFFFVFLVKWRPFALVWSKICESRLFFFLMEVCFQTSVKFVDLWISACHQIDCGCLRQKLLVWSKQTIANFEPCRGNS